VSLRVRRRSCAVDVRRTGAWDPGRCPTRSPFATSREADLEEAPDEMDEIDGASLDDPDAVPEEIET